MIDAATLGDEMRERVRVRLAVLGVTLADVARPVGMRRATATALVRRLPHVSVTSLLRLAEMMETTPAWLLEGDLVGALPTQHEIEEDVS